MITGEFLLSLFSAAWSGFEALLSLTLLRTEWGNVSVLGLLWFYFLVNVVFSFIGKILYKEGGS